MKHPVTRDLHDYWDATRAERRAPERSEIDPAAIRHILAYTFILDPSAAGSSRDMRAVSFRLSGTRLDALFQRELKGATFGSIWSPENADLVDAMLAAAIDDGVAVVAAATGAPHGYEAVDLELLLLPLRHHGRSNARLLGSLATVQTPGWMGLRTVRSLDLLSFRPLATDDRWRRSPTRRDPAPETHIRQVGPFRVYEGGRRVGASAEAGV